MPIDTNTHFTGLQDGKYSFDIMEKQMFALVKQYPFLILKEIGKSVQNRPLYCLTLGMGRRRVHVNGSHHANEWITSIVIMKSIEILCDLIKYNKTYLGINASKLLKNITYDFVPMVNPDGVELCIGGIQDEKQLSAFEELNEGIKDFSRWKANARGIDLNRNYDAGFEAYQAISEKAYPSYAYYQGSRPECEPESRALADLTRRRQYDMVFAYHTQGEVIYWTYKDIAVCHAKEYAVMFSKASSYELDVPEPNAASGGYKDWFILYFKKPGFTIECGHGENPIDSLQLDTILTQTFPILLLASKDIKKAEKYFAN